jgi:hypothetical protein
MMAPPGSRPESDPELAERLRRHVDRLAGLIGPRHIGRFGALDTAASLVEREFSESGYAVQRQPYRVHNVEASDNSSFWDQGYPALMLTDTSFLRNPHYHLPTDTPDTLDYPSITQVTLGVTGAVARLAGRADSSHTSNESHTSQGLTRPPSL